MVYLFGLLIPARNLVNGRSIIIWDSGDTIEYHQIELATHDVIFAEGVTAETLLTDVREAFDNGAEYEELYGPDVEMRNPFAPISSVHGASELVSHLRSVVAPLYDVRRPFDIIRDQIADRAEHEKIAA